MAEKLIDINLSNEVQTSFLNYAMSVIVARALPDVRDGFKPVHRRIIYSMHELGLTADKPHRKCARIVGDVLGKYHPHGDSSVYDALVRLAQDFSIRYLLVDGHGNFGSVDGDGAAAMRYTEARMAKITSELIRDIGKNTVDFMDNFDASEKEPVVLPARFPNLLVNGSTGIAVGMATNIPPHNLREVIDGIVMLIDNPDVDIMDIISVIKGPDFPTGASILGNAGIVKAYTTGKGTITIRSKVNIDTTGNKDKIIITEIPYQVNKANLISRIADLVKEKTIDGIATIVDESNRNGMKVVIDVKRDANANVVLNNLYKHTSLQTSYGINMLALVDGQPRILNIKEILEKYLEHQRIVIVRRTKYDLEKALNRAHILEGLKIALDNIDEIVQILKSSKTDVDAMNEMINRFSLTEIQAKAILDMRMRRLTGLERDKILGELKELELLIKDLKDILSSDERVLTIIKEELLEIKNKYGDDRKTIIDMTAIDYIEDESLIPVANIVLTLTDKGYIKRLPLNTYKTQNRGGVGIKGMSTNDEDYVELMTNATTHDYILFFSSCGKVYRIKGYEIPEFSRQSKGLPIINLLSLDNNEKIMAILRISHNDVEKYLIFGTKLGYVKRTDISEFENIRTTGKKFITLRDDDELIAVKKTTGNCDILMAGSNGRMVRFNEDSIRVMGRVAAGVKGITLGDSCNLVGLEVVNENQDVLVLTTRGYGKRTPIGEYRITNRGGKGVKTLNITEKNGDIISFKTVNGDEDLMIITNEGIVIRLDVNQISVLNRVTQGVKLINLRDNQFVSSASLIDKTDAEDEVVENDLNAHDI
ncbi:MAG: DNA gyrase subunit A [bacterium]|nr:DNA gyrase subunit A [bacterium]